MGLRFIGGLRGDVGACCLFSSGSRVFAGLERREIRGREFISVELILYTLQARMQIWRL